MISQLLYAAFVFVATVLPAHAGAAKAPELDGGTLSSLAAAFTGCYVAFRLYRTKAK